MRNITHEEIDAVLADIRPTSKQTHELTEEYLLANAILTANRLKIKIDELKDLLKQKKTIDSNNMLIISTFLKQMCVEIDEISLKYLSL